MSAAVPAQGEMLELAAGAIKQDMPRQLFMMSGLRLVEQPTVHDTGSTLRSRVATELGVARESVQLLHGSLFVSDKDLLADLHSGHLQVIVGLTLKQKLKTFWKMVRHSDESVNRCFDSVEIDTVEELYVVVSSIIKQAVSCRQDRSEICAKTAAVLHRRSLEFPALDVASKRVTPTRVLINMCQKLFEGLSMPKRHAEQTEPFIRFVLNLFVQRLLSMTVIGLVIDGLIEPPEDRVQLREHVLELGRLARSGTRRELIQMKIQNIVSTLIDDSGDRDTDDDYDRGADDYDRDAEIQRYRLMGLDMYGQG